MFNEPNSPPKPQPDLGMATSDLAYRDLDEVVHPGRREEHGEEDEDDAGLRREQPDDG